MRLITSLSALFLCTNLSLSAQVVPAGVAAAGTPVVSNDYQPKDFSNLLGMPGFNDDLLKMHFQLYQGYVKNTNFLINRLKDLLLQDKADSYDFTALKRRLGWEWDGMRLHELYFQNLGGKDSLSSDSALYRKLSQDFGSFELWKREFIATGMTRGIGWVILYQDPLSGKLINTWINEHDLGHLSGAEPLLVMDVFEHAYITQYGLDRKKYIEAFFDNIDWKITLKRYTN